MSASERQRKFREAQAALGRRSWTVLVTEDERFYLERLLGQLRDGSDLQPALMRDKRGRFVAFDA